MPNKAEWIDAVEMSRRLRIMTGEKLSRMTRDERLRYFNKLATTDPVLQKMKRASPPGHVSPHRFDEK